MNEKKRGGNPGIGMILKQAICQEVYYFLSLDLASGVLVKRGETERYSSSKIFDVGKQPQLIHQNHSWHVKVQKIWKKYNLFKISPILANFPHMTADL